MKHTFEEVILTSSTNMEIGGYLEEKYGEECLRLCDSIETIRPGRYRITRSWLRPFMVPFDRLIYGYRRPQ